MAVFIKRASVRDLIAEPSLYYLVNWDEELLTLELHEILESNSDLSLTGFDSGEVDGLLALEDEERANAASLWPAMPSSRLFAAGRSPLLEIISEDCR